ncbi:glycosyl hydrolase 108 family protein [Pararhizobium sp.]|uniref:glycosyl hydrolase 108 family protein n=1 Tax=Pararhizobium sp. TaxID=1977563 RepID=UPI00271A538B|nr:glycosyl hydrolase 108 family protein [Pararhizobium sp.]MDO9414573.1 glycosyl hydrolase 108 family protein [Pararhizobium sp.]
MASPTSRQTDTESLHPAIREAVAGILADLAAGGHPFEIFEAFRSPERQAYLYAQGRSAKGKIVTKAPPWSSYHQYGLAVDFVLKINGKWDWTTSGKYAAHWKALHRIGRQHGLEPLSWEMPHLQLSGLAIEDLRKGEYPEFGDDSWAETLAMAIAGWTGSSRAPPPPTIFPTRPPLAPGHLELEETFIPSVPSQGTLAGTESGELDRPAVPSPNTEQSSMAAAGKFERIQAYIDKWEGGYVDHPADPGGATNMGITQATLARWRGREVSKSEVKALSRTEQRQIMKALYYDVINADDLPAPLAAVTYNAAILHGTGKAARFLQTVLKKYRPEVEIDGAIGQQTTGAAAAVPAAQVASDFIATELAYLQTLSHWPVFGKGWTSRLVDVRNFAVRLDAGIAPPPVDEQDEPEIGWTGGSTTFPPAPPPVPPLPVPPGNLPITNMLGTAIGKLLNGKKTAIGVLSLLGLTIFPELGKVLPFDTSGTEPLADLLKPIAGALTAWGFSSKIEKLLFALKAQK